MNQSCQSCHQPLTPVQPELLPNASHVQCRNCGTSNALLAQNPEMSEFSGSTAVLRIQPQGVAAQPASRIAEVTAHFAADQAKDSAQKAWFVVTGTQREGPFTAIEILARHRAQTINDQSLLLGPDDVVPQPLGKLLPQLTQPTAHWHQTTEAAFNAVGQTPEDQALSHGQNSTPLAADEGDFSDTHTMAMRLPSASPMPAVGPTQTLGTQLFDAPETGPGAAVHVPVSQTTQSSQAHRAASPSAAAMPPRATVLGGPAHAPSAQKGRAGLIIAGATVAMVAAAGALAWFKLHG